MIYLDYNATSPLRSECLEVMLPYLSDHFGNPSSMHLAGQRARQALDLARHQVAALINAQPSEIIFTSGGTEANNLALIGSSLTTESPTIAISRIEHPAVLKPVDYLVAQHRATRIDVPVDTQGIVDLAKLEESLARGPTLLSIMWANNEIGSIQPIAEIVRLAQTHRVPFHSDAVQAAGRLLIDVKAIPIDLLSLAAHKLGGPKGVGALYLRHGRPIRPIHHGGSHERLRRAGTENIPGIVGFGAACAAISKSMTPETTRVEALRNRLEAEITRTLPESLIFASRAPRLPNTLNAGFPGCDAESILMALDLQDIAVSSGAACSSGNLSVSHVLSAMGVPRDVARSSIRFSLGFTTTAADIDRTVQVLTESIDKIRRIKRGD